MKIFLVGDKLKKFNPEVKPIAGLPIEVMIEVESRCNFSCRFCFNHISFARKSRNIKAFTTPYLRRVINGIAKAGIKIVRFTGGEPLLRKDIFDLFKYAKMKGLEVWLNTNGSLVDKDNNDKFKNLVDNVLIPIESWSEAEEEMITGYKGSLSRKIKSIKFFKKIGVPVLRAGTVATKENIKNFDRLAYLILRLPIDEWEFYRPISTAEDRESISSSDIKKLVFKILKLRKILAKKISIANAIPFCAIDTPNKLNAVSSGALFEDGHCRLVIDPRGFVKPHYFIDKNIGNPVYILAAWNHPFMKKMRNLTFLPNKCSNCVFKLKCRGGSRYEAKINGGSYNSPDPLANFKNKIT